MLRTHVGELEARFTAIEAGIPPDGESITGSDAEPLLGKLDDTALKDLSIYGLGALLERAFPDLPHVNSPDSNECLTEISALYIAKEKFAREPVVHQLTGHGHAILIDYVATPLRQSLSSVDDVRFRAIRAIQLERYQRQQNDKPRTDWLHLSANQARDSIEFQLYNQMWGASRMQISELIQRISGIPEKEISAKEFGRIAPRIRQVLCNPAYRMHIKRMSGLAINHMMVLADSGRWNDGVRFESDGNVTVPEKPASIAEDETHYSTQETGDKVGVGCPARYARGAIQWAPNMMLTACVAIASHPPLPGR